MPNRRLSAIGAITSLVLIAACAGQHPAIPSLNSAASRNATHKKTYASGGTSLALTPNFNVGFGPVPSVAAGNRLPSPAPGPNATLDGGNIDFGTVSPGLDYYYRYGMELAISASSSYQVTASISGDLAPGIPGDMLTWLASSSTHYNTLDEAAFGGRPFGSQSAPLVIASGASGSSTLKYDYILIVPNVEESGASTAQIEYTVVP